MSETRSRAQTQPNEFQALLKKLNEQIEQVAGREPGLERAIRGVVDGGNDPARANNTVFRTQVAYVVQDTEKLVGPLIPDGTALRREMDQRAVSYPGLDNDRVKALLEETPGIENRNTIRQIRQLAAESAKLGEGRQNTPDIISRVERIEGQVRLSTQPGAKQEATSVSDQAAAERGRTERVDPATSTNRETPQGTQSVNGGREKHAPSDDNPVGGPAPAAKQTAATGQSGQAADQQQNAQFIRGPGAIARILAAATNPEFRNPDNWERPPTPFAERHASFRDEMAGERAGKTEARAERAAEAALSAMQAFSNGPGSGFMARLQDAAKTDPGGLQGVLSGMHEGGKYAGLRHQFEAERQITQGFAAAFDRAADSVGAYGRLRGEVAQIAEQRGKVDAVNGRFQTIDAEIGEAASSIPGRKPGARLIDEMAEKIVEIAQRAAEAVRSMFTRSPSAEMKSAPSPAA